MSTNTNIPWIDIAKGYGILLVIIGHIYHLDIIYSFHLPLFFILSGYTHKAIQLPFIEHLKKKVKTIVIPYFSLGLVLLIFTFFFTYRDNKQPLSDYVDLTMDFLIQKRTWTLWFLTCSFITNIFFYALIETTKNNIKKILLIITCMITLMLIYYKNDGKAWIWNADASIMALSFYFSGFLLKKYNLIEYIQSTTKNRKFYLLAFFVSLNLVFLLLNKSLGYKSLEMWSNQYSFFPFLYIAAIAGTLALIVISLYKNPTPISFIGKNSIIYFAWHQSIAFPIIDTIYYRKHLFTDDSFFTQSLKFTTTIFLTVTSLTFVAIIIRKLNMNIFTGIR